MQLKKAQKAGDREKLFSLIEEYQKYKRQYALNIRFNARLENLSRGLFMNGGSQNIIYLKSGDSTQKGYILHNFFHPVFF